MKKFAAFLIFLGLLSGPARSGNAAEKFFIPVMGPSVHIYDQSAGEKKPWYINDHCLVKGPDRKYHLFGITHEKEMVPPAWLEREFAHASSAGLFQVPWQKHPTVVKFDEKLGEDHVWAPHVIEKDGSYYMFYAGGGGSENSMINLAVSKDLFHWERPAVNPLFRDFFDARDPMVLKVGDEYLMYYCKTFSKKDFRSTVALRRSRDLIHWSQPEFALVLSESPRLINSGHTESPFVFSDRGKFYLAVCSPYYHYRLTRVFVSDNPCRFDEKDEVTSFIAHCAEFPEFDGRHYISHAGWFYEGVYLAPVSFVPARKFSPQFLFLNAGESEQYLAAEARASAARAGPSSPFAGNKLLRIRGGGSVDYEIPVPGGVELMQLFVGGKGDYQIAVAGRPLKSPKDPASVEGIDLYWLDDPGLWTGGKLQLKISSPAKTSELNFLRLYFVR